MKKLTFKKRDVASVAILGAALTLLPSQAFATTDNLEGFTGIADGILDFMRGPIATAVGAIAIAVVGYRWFSGRMEMGRAAATIGGIVLVIGSVQIVSFIRSGTSIQEPDSDSNLQNINTQFAELNAVTLARRLV